VTRTLLGCPPRRGGLHSAVLAFPEPGHGIRQGRELGEQGKQMLGLAPSDEPRRGQQYRRGPQPPARGRGLRHPPPHFPRGAVVLPGRGGQRPTAAALDNPSGSR